MRWLRPSPVASTVACLLVALLGGAVAPGEEGETENGAITGIVLDPNLEAVVGATLLLFLDGKLLDGTTTNANGTYLLDEVPPGTYLLFAGHVGYEGQTRNVDVHAGELTTQNFLLIPLAETPVPWVDGPHEWIGFIACAVAGVPVCQLDPDHDVRHVVDVEPGMRTLSLVLDWEATGLFPAEELVLEVHVAPPSPALASERGPPPLALRLEHTALEGFDPDESHWSADIRVKAPLIDHQVIYQQEVTMYWAVHYWGTAPPDYSPAPD